MSRTKLFIGLALAAAVTPSLAMAGEASSGGWDWFAAPYLFASSVSTNLNEGGSSNADFSDIISKIDMAFQGHVEGQGDTFGAFGDLTYLSLSDSNTHPNFNTDASIKLSIVELAGVWNIEPEHFEGADLFAGMRHLKADADFTIDPTNSALPTTNIGITQNFSDFMVGARYNATLSDRWGLSLRADGGWGDTDGDYNLSAMLRYKLGGGSMSFGYRYMDLKFKANTDTVNIKLSGPVIAYVFGL